MFRSLGCIWLLATAIAQTKPAETKPSEPALAVVQPTLHEAEDGPPVPAGYRFVPGQIVYFSFLVSGYKKTGVYPDWKIDVAYEVDVRDSQGALLAPPDVNSVGTSVSEEDKQWLPKVRYEFAIPPLAESGVYKILLKVWDRFGKTETQAEQSFRIEGHKVEPSDTLVIRNFRFLRSEEDKNPLTIAAYRPGDAIWARFDMTGYKFGDGNSFDVEYGITITDAAGAVKYSQPHAAEEKTHSFYPQRYTPGVVNLNIPSDMKKASYTLIVTATDRLGGQTAETKQNFSVE